MLDTKPHSHQIALMKVLNIVFASLVLSLASCASLKEFYNSPSGKIVISAGGSYIVSEAVKSKPELIPVLEALADTQEGATIDLTQFDEPLLGLGVQVVGAVVTHYGDDTAPRLIARTIRQGVVLAQLDLAAEESNK